jgi:hypothetical protein
VTDQDPLQHQETDGAEPPAGEGGKRASDRFSVVAIRGKRARYTRFEILRAVLITLGVGVLLLFAVAQWLALQPAPMPSLDLPTLRVPGPTTSITPGSGALAGQTATAGTTSSASPTAQPSPTRTFVPTVTRRPTATPTIPTPTPQPYPAPLLLEPADGETPPERALFRWQWDGPPLAANQAFELRIWSAQEEQAGSPRRGAVAPTRDTQTEVALPYVPAIQDYGAGDYYWTVVVVELRVDGPAHLIGTWGESRRFVYR